LIKLRLVFQNEGSVSVGMDAMRKYIKSLGVTAGLLGMISAAHAGGFSLREQSAEGQGASFAGVAAGTEGPSGLFWNPATMTQHTGQGLLSESNVNLIIPYSRAKDGGTAPGVPAAGGFDDSGNIGVTAVVPASYWVYDVDGRLVVGASLNAPFGLGTNSDNWIGSPHGDRSKAQTYNLTPSAAYKLSEHISIGAGLQIQYMTVDLNSRTPVGDEFFKADGSALDIGFTAGLLFEPVDGTDIGIGFRSSISHRLKGEGSVAGVFQGDIFADFKSPETVTLGLRQDIGEDFRLLAGVEWANWSRFEELNIRAEGSGATVGVTEEDWNDSWFIALGGEYDFNDQLTLRAGVAFEDSPVPDRTRTPRIPDNDRIWLSVGASYDIAPNMRANFAYSHIFVEDGDVSLAGGGGLPPLYANFEQSVDIVSASLTMDW
jgi:long-chain fatty acid transport protein